MGHSGDQPQKHKAGGRFSKSLADPCKAAHENEQDSRLSR